MSFALDPPSPGMRQAVTRPISHCGRWMLSPLLYQALFIRIKLQWGGGSGGGASAGWVGLKLWTPPPLIIPRVSWVGLQPPLLSLVTGALSGGLLAPLSALLVCRHHAKRGKKYVFTPCVYTYGHFSSHPKTIISSLTVCFSKLSSILVGGTLHTQLQDLGFNFSGWHIRVIAQKPWSCFPLFFSPWLIMKLICKGKVM